MNNKVEKRLSDLGINLPPLPQPIANYLPYVTSGEHVFISGQLPFFDGEIHDKGKIGKDLSVENGQATARYCCLNLLSNLKAACNGDLSQVTSITKLGGHINSTFFVFKNSCLQPF